MKTEALTAGRQKHFIVLVGPYQLAISLTQMQLYEAGTGDTTYGEASHTVTFKATDETLRSYNADLTKPVEDSSSNGCWSSLERWGSLYYLHFDGQ